MIKKEKITKKNKENMVFCGLTNKELYSISGGEDKKSLYVIVANFVYDLFGK